MGITFNADEVFAMAQEIEANGARFYRKAAEDAPDGDSKRMLLDMATMEEGHERTFSEMRKELCDADRQDNVFDPDNEAVMYLQAMADARGWEGKVSPEEELSGLETMAEVLNAAIAAEKNSVAFYLGIRDIVPENTGKEKIDDIIKEEMGHITILSQKMRSLKKI